MGSEWEGFFGNYFMMKNCDFWMKDDFFQSLTLVLTQKQKIIIGFQARNVTKNLFWVTSVWRAIFQITHENTCKQCFIYTLSSRTYILLRFGKFPLPNYGTHKKFLKFFVVYKIFPDFVIWSLLTFFTW